MGPLCTPWGPHMLEGPQAANSSVAVWQSGHFLETGLTGSPAVRCTLPSAHVQSWLRQPGTQYAAADQPLIQ